MIVHPLFVDVAPLFLWGHLGRDDDRYNHVMHQVLLSQDRLDLRRWHHKYQKKKESLQTHYVEGSLKTDYAHPVRIEMVSMTLRRLVHGLIQQ